MEVLGIGPSELVMVVLIALIVLGPRDMQKAGRTLGQWLNALVHSDSWKVVQKTSHELRNLPTNLMREANLEMIKTEADIRKAIRTQSTPSNPGDPNPPEHASVAPGQNPSSDITKHEDEEPSSTTEHTIHPPQAAENNERSHKGD
jgi:sec-independent protein translocase protein TatB